jgi:hypothetical protein
VSECESVCVCIQAVLEGTYRRGKVHIILLLLCCLATGVGMGCGAYSYTLAQYIFVHVQLLAL